MLVLNNSCELGTTYLQVFLLWMLFSFICLRLFCRNRSFYAFLSSFKFTCESRINWKSAAGKVGLTLPRCPPKAPCGDWAVWQNFSLLFNAIDSEKCLGYAICQACKRRYVKLSVYKHDRDQSDTKHSSVYFAPRQNLCWDYFAFI